MPNVDDLEQWLTRMTSQHTIMVRSDYRPCKLESKFVFYEENPKNRRGAWDTNELLRISESLKIVKAFPKDQFIVFTGGKMWGRKALERFTQEKISINLVKEFKEGTTRVLISSSLLAYGLNLPARRVVVAHLKRGNLDVATCDLIQMAGRAGRPRFDTEGTVYFLVPKDNDSDRQIRRIRKGEEIVSQLSEKDNLMFHVVAEIFIGTINDVETFRDWYSRSLACIQDGDITSEEAEDVLTSLEKMCMIRKKEGSDRIYESTNLGKVCAWMYHSPADVFSWWQNFSKIFGQQHISDEEWAWALTNTNTWRNEYVSNAEKKFISDYVSTLEHKNIDVEGGASKWGACVCNMLKGWADDEMPALRSIASNFTFDLDRMMETLKMIDQMYGMWKKQKTFDMMKLRLRYRVSQDKVNLVRVKGIGGVYANKLFEQGITNVDDLLKEDNIVVVKGVMGKKYQTVVESAKKIKAGEVDYDNDR
jgi:replicative superfamily II helicase